MFWNEFFIFEIRMLFQWKNVDAEDDIEVMLKKLTDVGQVFYEDLNKGEVKGDIRT